MSEQKETPEQGTNELLEKALDYLRSAYNIASRRGKETNWDAFLKKTKEVLHELHEYKCNQQTHPKPETHISDVMEIGKLHDDISTAILMLDKLEELHFDTDIVGPIQRGIQSVRYHLEGSVMSDEETRSLAFTAGPDVSKSMKGEGHYILDNETFDQLTETSPVVSEQPGKKDTP